MNVADSKSASKAGDSGEAEVQAKFDEAEDKGYHGETVDETPRENYTLAGVVAGKPTPENGK